MTLLTDAEMAKALLGTTALPPGLAALRARAAEAWAYHRLDPYPLYHFREWKGEDRGPLPRCLPIAKSIVRRGARFLFGKPLTLTCPGNTAWESFVRRAWLKNGLGARLVPMAERAALESGVVLKFSYDSAKADCPLAIQSLSIVDQVRLYASPHDRTTVLMARVQYPYFDAAQKKTCWYREEWTAAEEVHYVPLEDGGVNGSSVSRFDPDASDAWVRDDAASKPNPFGVIPLLYIKNYETDDVWGGQDLADLYRVLDNIHLTYHLMNKSNQFDSEINPIFFDVDLDAQDIDKPLKPGQPMDLKSDNAEGGGHAGRVEFPSGGNSLRPAMMEYAKDLKKQVIAAAASVEVDQSEFTNKGNLTVAVLEQLFQAQIEGTDEKRKSWGEFGLVPFFALVAQGISNAGAALGVDTGLGINPDDPDTYELTLGWSPYFPMSEDEKAAKTARIQDQEQAGYVTHDRAIEEVAPMEGRTDIEALKEELKTAEPYFPPVPPLPPGDVTDLEAGVKWMQRLGGDSSK